MTKTNGFTKTSVTSGTLGSVLKRMRANKDLTLEEISNATKIQVKYLRWLEEDNCKRLPAPVYVEGFLKSYAKFMNEDYKEIIALFKKEQDIRENILNKNKDFGPIKPLKDTSIIISSKAIVVSLVCCVALVSFAYLYRQAYFIFAPPKIEISTPLHDTTVSNQTIEISGKSSVGSQIFINDQSIFANADGTFQESVKLSEGLNILKISSVNKMGKESKVIRNIIYQPKADHP
ncbi:helix-turn-helix domain-containing protein [bacterium]|nr:MAG: helix-turn-helix domain-containing protein [bacterium]